MKGAWAEDLALEHLLGQGYTLLRRNARTPYGEIDLLMQEGGYYVVVEVKQRRSAAFGTPLEAITPRKLARLQKSALFLLGRDDLPLRFEALLISGNPDNFRIEKVLLS